VPLWGIATWFRYAARRVQCPEHGVVVEHLPWSEGKRPVTIAMMCFLSGWARRLSWRETARAFHTSWECVYRSVEWFVQWGLAHRKLESVWSLGVDEIHWGKSKRADSFLTVIYQIDGHCRRLLWVGKRRTQATLRRGLATLGDEVVGGLRFVCSDMWKPYLNVLAAEAKGLNNKIRVITRRSYGFRTFKAMEIALYHTLGRLPEPRGIAFGI
jgi:transposase